MVQRHRIHLEYHEARTRATVRELGGFNDPTEPKFASSRIVGTLFAIDPAAAAVVGALMLNQVPGLPMLSGLALVIASGAAAIWCSGRPGAEPEASAGATGSETSSLEK